MTVLHEAGLSRNELETVTDYHRKPALTLLGCCAARQNPQQFQLPVNATLACDIAARSRDFQEPGQPPGGWLTAEASHAPKRSLERWLVHAPRATSACRPAQAPSTSLTRLQAALRCSRSTVCACTPKRGITRTRTGSSCTRRSVRYAGAFGMPLCWCWRVCCSRFSWWDLMRCQTWLAIGSRSARCSCRCLLLDAAAAQSRHDGRRATAARPQRTVDGTVGRHGHASRGSLVVFLQEKIECMRSPPPLPIRPRPSSDTPGCATQDPESSNLTAHHVGEERTTDHRQTYRAHSQGDFWLLPRGPVVGVACVTQLRAPHA